MIALLTGFATGRLGWCILAVMLAFAGGGVVGGLDVHSYDQAQHDKAVADLRAAAATTLAKAEQTARDAEYNHAITLASLEESYARLSTERDRLAQDGARLSADLSGAVERLRGTAAHRGGSGGGLPPADGTADGCADLRAALGRTLGALERLESGGDAAAAIGQHAVDVATIAAQAADKALTPGPEITP